VLEVTPTDPGAVARARDRVAQMSQDEVVDSGKRSPQALNALRFEAPKSRREALAAGLVLLKREEVTRGLPEGSVSLPSGVREILPRALRDALTPGRGTAGAKTRAGGMSR